MISISETAIPAGVIQERFSPVKVTGHDFANENLMIASGQDLDDPAVDECQAVGQYRHCGGGGGSDV